MIARNVVGEKLQYGDSTLTIVPVFRGIYTSIRQILENFSAPDKTGFLQILKEEEVVRTNISVDDVLKMIVSAGRMTPERLPR